MKKFLFALFICSLELQAKIIETHHIDLIGSFVNKDTFIIFDIDNTLMEPVQELGTDQWFYHQWLTYENEGMSKRDALERALKEWTAIQSITAVKAVEEAAVAVVADLQEGGFDIIGLTTRGLGLAHRTIEQLSDISIDLSHNAPSHEEIHFMNGDQHPEGVIFRKGVLFTAGTHKGKALFKLLEKIGYSPKEILFINDKATHLREVEIICEERGIPFTGLRYSFLDEKVKNFRKELADIQFQHFGKILSDEEAGKVSPH